jgi:peptidoglycan/LPS O-acetylase OafA/YrhL
MHEDRNRALDAVRGVAILQVVVWHLVAPIVLRHLPIAGRALSLTWSGVDLFFVLSGYLIGSILIRNRGATNYYRVFYARRVLRIAPLYLVTLALFFAIWPQPFGLEYVMLTQNIVWSLQDTFGPGAIAMTWSLAVEEQFYLCLPLLVVLCPPRRLPWVLAGLALVAPVIRIALHAHGLPHAAYMLLPARMDSLLLGVLIAWAQIAGMMPKVSSLQIAAALTGLACIALAFSGLDQLGPVIGTVGYSVVALFYAACLALLVTTGLRLPAWLNPLAKIGLGAYSLYLFHAMVGAFAIDLIGPRIWAFVAMAVGCAGVAWFCYRYIEKPLGDFGHARFRYRAGVKVSRHSPAAPSEKISA